MNCVRDKMDRLRQTVKSDVWIILLDAIAVNISYLAALVARFYINNDVVPGQVFYIGIFYRFAPYYTLLSIIVFYLFRIGKISCRNSKPRVYESAIMAIRVQNGDE